MPAKQRDYSVLDRFHFEHKPVGVKYLPTRPKGIRKLEKALNFCEMIKEAQDTEPFYVAPDNWHCVEPHLLGFEDFPSIYNSGLFGADEGLYQEARANRQLYNYLPQMVKGSVQYVAFGPVDKLPFDPDVMVLTATMEQAPTVLRALNYSTGEPIVSKTTPVVACSWLMVYPVISGEMNYVVTGLGLGMDAMDMFPAGLFLISIPFQKLGEALRNLAEIRYQEGPRPPRPGGDAHRARVETYKEELQRKWAE
jgi:uncharacterized protein (DUF169 family)